MDIGCAYRSIHMTGDHPVRQTTNNDEVGGIEPAAYSKISIK